MTTLRFSTALAFALALLSPGRQAAAVTAEPVQVVCPLDGTLIDARRAVAINAMGGTDSDFCQYSSGGQAREYGVVTCPTCFYSALVSSFERSLAEDQKRALLEMLGSATHSHPPADQLNPWDRYELAALCAGVLDEPLMDRGDLLLHGAWTVRDRVVGFLPGIDGPLDVLLGLDELDVEWERLTDLRTRQMALFDMARVAHRGGLNDRRDAYLARLDDLPPVPPELREIRAKVRDLIALEERYLAKAKMHYEEALAQGEGTPQEKVYLRYLIVDLRRRLGETTGLTEELNLILTDPDLTEEVRVAAKSLREVLKPRKEP